MLNEPQHRQKKKSLDPSLLITTIKYFLSQKNPAHLGVVHLPVHGVLGPAALLPAPVEVELLQSVLPVAQRPARQLWKQTEP